MGAPLMNIGDVGKGLYLRTSMSISLHLVPLSRMSCSDAKSPTSLRIKGDMLIENLGMTSTTVRSSTYFALEFQCLV